MSRPQLSRLVSIFPALLLLGACTTEKIVEVERPVYNPPADAASGFVGYYSVADKQTTCGNCHSDKQAEWVETRHAGAYKTLKDLPAGVAQSFCFSCHDVTTNGNFGATKPAGYDKVADSTYRDVQCESCHGPGQQHIESVVAGSVIRPYARISIGIKDDEPGGIVATADTAYSCAACHTGEHHPFVEQWVESRHALVRKDEVQRAAPNTCAGCHEGRGALKKWGIEAKWVEGAYSESDPITKMMPATCGVCHDPHGGGNTHQLRYPINSPDETVNLCVKCHNNRAQPSNTSTSPHGAQGGVLFGFAGWRPPNFVYDTARIYGSHASPTANADLCAGCHVQRQTINDASGKFQLQSVGHLFKPVPCLDSKGNPTGDDSCAWTATARSWNACTKSGCHATAAVAANVLNTTRAELKQLADVLWKNTYTAGTCSGGGCPTLDPQDTGYLAKLKAARPQDWQTPTSITPGEGCEFNVRTLGEGLASHPDNSKGAHNAFLARALLSSCISYLLATYPTILPAPPAEVQAIVDRWGAPVMGNLPIIARVPLPASAR